MIKSECSQGMAHINIKRTGLARVVDSAAERANRTKIEAGGNSRATGLASRCGFWFHGSKTFVGKRFADDYNSSPAAVHGLISLSIFDPATSET